MRHLLTNLSLIESSHLLDVALYRWLSHFFDLEHVCVVCAVAVVILSEIASESISSSKFSFLTCMYSSFASRHGKSTSTERENCVKTSACHFDQSLTITRQHHEQKQIVLQYCTNVMVWEQKIRLPRNFLSFIVIVNVVQTCAGHLHYSASCRFTISFDESFLFHEKLIPVPCSLLRTSFRQ